MSQQITGTTGTFTTPKVLAKNAGQSITLGEGDRITNILTGALQGGHNIGLGAENMSMDSKEGIQKDMNAYQEIMSFVTMWATATGQDGLSAMRQIRWHLDSMLNSTEVIRSYNP
jgi:hypothetical protein